MQASDESVFRHFYKIAHSAAVHKDVSAGPWELVRTGDHEAAAAKV